MALNIKKLQAAATVIEKELASEVPTSPAPPSVAMQPVDRYREQWVAQHSRFWGVLAHPPKSMAIISNSGHPKGPEGTMIYLGLGTGDVEVTYYGREFRIEFNEMKVFELSGKQWRQLPPLSVEQKVFWGVDFGGQFSS